MFNKANFLDIYVSSLHKLAEIERCHHLCELLSHLHLELKLQQFRSRTWWFRRSRLRLISIGFSCCWIWFRDFRIRIISLIQTWFHLWSSTKSMHPKIAFRLKTTVWPVLGVQLFGAYFAEFRSTLSIWATNTNYKLMLMGFVAYLWWHKGTVEMKINFTKCAAIGECIANFPTSVAYKWTAAISWRRNQDQRMQGMSRMVNITSCISTMLMKEEIACPASINGIMAKRFAPMATTNLPLLHFVDIEIVLVAEMLVLHYFLFFLFTLFLLQFLLSSWQINNCRAD